MNVPSKSFGDDHKQANAGVGPAESMMKRVFALALMFTLALGNLSSLSAQVQAIGVISGSISGPTGPLAGVTVNVLGPAGNIVGTAVTTSAGSFSVGGLAVGSFSVQA